MNLKETLLMVVSLAVICWSVYKIKSDVLPYFIHFGPEIQAPSKRMVVKVPENFFPKEYLIKNKNREIDPDILYVEDKNVKEPTELGYEGEVEINIDQDDDETKINKSLQKKKSKAEMKKAYDEALKRQKEREQEEESRK